MSISASEDELFEEWRRIHGVVSPDGVVDESTYTSSENRRLLFILKEVNDTGETGFDLRKGLWEGANWPRSQTWHNIVRWVHGLNCLGQDVPWNLLDKLNDLSGPGLERRAGLLRSIAAMNLKKSPGGHTARNDKLKAAASQGTELLTRQYELYSPDLVVCCGSATHWPFQVDVLGDTSLKRDQTSRGIPFLRLPSGGIAILYSHPGARVTPSLLHYGLIDAAREVLV